jgi:hypothetical protein
MASIAAALRRIKDQPPAFMSKRSIDAAARAAGHRWRERVLGPAATVTAWVLQIAHGNTAIGHVVRLFHGRFSQSAYCQARDRLPVELARTLLMQSARWAVDHRPGVWKGHRTFLADGTGPSMPDTAPLRERFGYPAGVRQGCGFPVAHVLTLFDAAAGVLVDMVVGPWQQKDMPGILSLHSHLRPGDVLIGDRAFCAFGHVTALLERGLHGVFRLHASRPVPVGTRARRRTCARGWAHRWAPALASTIEVIADAPQRWAKPSNRPLWMTPQQWAAQPATLTVRVVTYRVSGRGVRTRTVAAATTLMDAAAYPPAEIAALYHSRWEVETNLRHLKSTLGMDRLTCGSADGVVKELLMFAVVYNLVRAVMTGAGVRQGAEPGRVSFADALRWLLTARRGEQLPDLRVNPRRRGRLEPRVCKRRPKNFPYMIRPRDEYRRWLAENATVN